MTPTEHSPKPPRSTGSFAVLRGLLGRKGTGAPFAITLSILALALALLPGVASANGAHGYERAIGLGFGEGAGQLELAAPIREIEEDPYFRVAGSGVAVNDTSHDVYVADTGNHRVSEFEAGGKFVRAFGADVGELGEGTCTLICHAGTPGSAPGELTAPKFVAVDQGSGDVYVGTGVGRENANELEHVAFSKATGGTFTLSFEGETTEAIPYETVLGATNEQGAVAEAARAALEALAKIGPGNVKVTERGNNTNELVALVVEFRGGLALTPVGVLGCDASGLVPAGAGCVVAVEREGSSFVGEVISKFTAEGALVKSWGVDGQLSGSNATGTGNLTSGSATVEGVMTTTGAFATGQSISGTGIPAGATIVAVEPGKLVLSAPATATGSGVALTAAGVFGGALEGLAVGAAGELWVYDAREMMRFSETGEFQSEFRVAEGFAGASASGIALNATGDLFVAGKAVEELTGAGARLGTVSGVHDPDPSGIALDTATEHVFVGLGSSLEDADSSCLPLNDCEVFGAPELQGGAGVAVDSSVGDPPFSGTVYAADTVSDVVDVLPSLFSVETQPAGAVAVSSMTLHGTVDPEGLELSECYFEYGTSSEYEHTAACEESPATIGHGVSEVSVQAEIKGLRGGTTYHFRLVGKHGTNVVAGVDLTAGTPTVPVIAGAEALNVAAGSAELRATVNPEGSPISRCEFEYVEAAGYEAAAPDPYAKGHVVKCEQRLAQIGFGTAPVPVSAQITGLEPDTAYHWRLSVKDTDGEAYGADHTFVYPTTSSELPDHRAYEMVSPPFKNGASLGTIAFGPKYDLSEGEGAESLHPGPSRVIAESIQCLPGSLSCNAQRDGNHEGEPFEFTRTPAGWQPAVLSPPATLFSENDDWLLGAGEGMALFSAPTPPGGEDDWYATSAGGSFADIGPVSPPSAGPTELQDVGVPTATADLSHVVWGDEEYVGVHNAQPFSIDLTGGPDSGELIDDCGAAVGAPRDVGVNPLSADGRTVFVDVPPCASGSGSNAHTPVPAWELYARVDGEEPGAHTVAISQPQCGEGAQPDEVQCRTAAPGDAIFAGASEDGSRAFFLDTQKLTDEATQGTGTAVDDGCSLKPETKNCNLYLYNSGLPEGERLIDVSAGDTSGLGAQVQGVVATSADGSHVYFVANGVLASGARPGHCHNLSEGTCNLYVYQRDERYPQGHLEFIASVPGEDLPNWNEDVGRLGHEANVTPDGRFLVFHSYGALTPDDTRTDGALQIFRYDADQTAQEESENVPALVRVSIGDDGYNDNGNAGVGEASIVAAGELSRYQAGPFRGDPTMSNDGSYVFFQSPIGLTPHALNDALAGHVTVGETGHEKSVPIYSENVYEWHEGHVYLISDGHDVGATGVGPCGYRLPEGISEGFYSDVCLLGASASGHDVFFTTSDQLVPEDTDTQVDIYDAHVCEPASPCIQPAPQPLPPCIGEQCHGIPPARSPAASGPTETFNGALNPTPAPAKPAVKSLTAAQRLADALEVCRKEKKKSKRVACEKQARKKYSVAKKSSKKKGK